MIISALGLLLLLYPLANLPALSKHKQQTGRYFSDNSCFFVIKEIHFGNGLNMKNTYAFAENILLAVLLLFLGMFGG